jgi:hypothetical protein
MLLSGKKYHYWEAAVWTGARVGGIARLLH